MKMTPLFLTFYKSKTETRSLPFPISFKIKTYKRRPTKNSFPLIALVRRTSSYLPLLKTHLQMSLSIRYLTVKKTKSMPTTRKFHFLILITSTMTTRRMIRLASSMTR